MILQDLYDLYDLKTANGYSELPKLHWCWMNVAYELSITRDGEVLSCIPLADDLGKKTRRLMVPLAYVKRTSGVKPGFLCDHTQYVFGEDADKQRPGHYKQCPEHYEKFRELQRDVLERVDDDGAKAYLLMLDRYGVGELPDVCKGILSEDLKAPMVFRLAGDSVLLHERPAIRGAWEQYAEQREHERDEVVCLITGRRAPQAELFPQVTGLAGAKSAGASLVSCNAEAFTSYGESIAVGSISSEAAEKAGDALSYVLKDDRHNVSLGDDYVCFWTDAVDSAADDLLSICIDPDYLDDSSGSFSNKEEDVDVRDAVQEKLERLSRGEVPSEIPGDTRYYVMGISPNQARLSVRFYERGRIGELERNVATYLNDIKMVRYDSEAKELKVRFHSLCSCIEQAGVQRKGKKPLNVPKTLFTASMRAMVRGTAFPESLLREILMRTRADQGTKHPWDMEKRAAILRACLLRKARAHGKEEGKTAERRLTVALNEENLNQGYLLGRLFALLEKVQSDAIGNANATIRDRYMGAAATTPARVFPQLLKLAQHHISKSSHGAYVDRLVQQVLSKVDDGGFPRTLSYDDQGEFYIGYYQQKQELYVSKKNAQDADEQERK